MDALSDYLSGNDETLSAFAVRIGRAPSTLTRALSGKRDPSFDLARDVERGTSGRVSKLQFIEACLAARERAEVRRSEAAE